MLAVRTKYVTLGSIYYMDTTQPTFDQALLIIQDQEKQKHAGDFKIFYPDPVDADYCAQCGKLKTDHDTLNNSIYWCVRFKVHHKPLDEIMREAAMLYADLKVEWHIQSIQTGGFDKRTPPNSPRYIYVTSERFERSSFSP